MRKLALCAAICSTLFHSAGSARAAIEPRNLDEYYQLGEFYGDTHQYEEAPSTHSAMVVKFPKSREAAKGWLAIGKIHHRLMLETMAERHRAEARGDTAKREAEELDSKVKGSKAKRGSRGLTPQRITPLEPL